MLFLQIQPKHTVSKFFNRFGPRTKLLPRQWRLLQVLCADFSRVHFEI